MTTQDVLLNTNDIKGIIPHRDPLLLIDNILSLEHGKNIIANKLLLPTEPVFQGHFPDQPIYPGVYYVEAVAQTGAVLIFKSRQKEGIQDPALGVLSSIESARFKRLCRPGDLLRYEVSIEKARPPFFWLKGKVFVGEEIVADISLSVALKKEVV